MTSTATATTDVDISRPADDVWSTIVNEPGSWLGPGSSIDPVTGGDVVVNDVVTDVWRRGVVRSARPGEMLEIDWWPSDDPDDTSSVTIELTPSATGTRVTVTETAGRLRGTAGIAMSAVPWRAAMLMFAASSIRV